MDTQTARQTITPDELREAFRESKARFVLGYGLFTAMQKPVVRWSLEMHALAMRKKKGESNVDSTE